MASTCLLFFLICLIFDVLLVLPPIRITPDVFGELCGIITYLKAVTLVRILLLWRHQWRLIICYGLHVPYVRVLPLLLLRDVTLRGIRAYTLPFHDGLLQLHL
jgi:hypothetical protein